jgi:hypothetical protein
MVGSALALIGGALAFIYSSKGLAATTIPSTSVPKTAPPPPKTTPPVGNQILPGNPKVLTPRPPGSATTLALGEEGGRLPPQQRLPGTRVTAATIEQGGVLRGRPPAGATTQALGEEGGRPIQ